MQKRILVSFIVLGVGAIAAVAVLGSSQDSVDIDAQSVLSDTAPEEPNFEVLQPAEDTTEEIFFDPGEGVASYTGIIDDIQVAITQQPLSTEQLNADSEWLKAVASQIEAETVFQTQYGDTYLAQPSELTGEAQVVLLKTDQLLLTFRTDGSKISLISWADYINSITN